MSKGQHVPKGVGYFGFNAKHTKGKYHPSAVGGGREGVETYNSTSPQGGDVSASTKSRVPKGVVKGSGTEPRGSNPSTKGPTTKSYPSPPKLKSRIPAAVSKHSGK